MPTSDKFETIYGSKKTKQRSIQQYRTEPKFDIEISSIAPLELTVTRSAVNLLQNIVKVS